MVTLTLLPLFITILAGLSALSTSLYQYHRGHQLCRRQLLETQNQFILIIKKLTLLNPRAHKLRQKRKLAEKRLKLALGTANLKMIAAAKAHLTVITVKQIKHRAKQQKWISLARKVQHLARREFSHLIKTKFNGSLVTLEPPKYKFAITSKPSLSLTPNHLPQSSFENRQRAFAKWSLRFKSIFPPWLSILVNANGVLTFQCSATISRKENRWTPSLSVDKSLLKF